ncbi:hypothetical protein GGR53DRAFT_493968 [Hypoxylon sp. FL1150]|nr:hypothetical protein GGR53DRAFT_493968 [Hypoxylon sp. FL1150]
MAAVYREASVTVAAVSSASSDEPFLAPRNRVLQERLLLLGLSRADRQLSAEELGIVAPHVNTAPSYALGIRPLAVHTSTGPLSSRAWTFQEEKLSSRILRFSATELSYECRRGVACECDMHGAHYNNAPEVAGLPPLHGLAITEQNDEGVGEGDSDDPVARPQRPPAHPDPFLAWQDRVAEYSRRNLTFASDKLPALAGLATVCHAITKSTYLAGLWRDHLLYDLLWRPANDSRFHPEKEIPPSAAAWKSGVAIAEEKLPDPTDLGNCYVKKLCRTAAHENFLAPHVAEAFGTPLATSSESETPTSIGFVEEYRAPTFSWASVDCAVKFQVPDPSHDVAVETTVLDAQCTVDGLNPFGRVSDGYAVLRGPLLQVEIATRPLRSNYGTYILKHDGVGVGFKPDLPLAVDCSDSSNVEARVRRATVEDSPHVRFRGVSVWCLSLLRSCDNSTRAVLVLGRSARVPHAFERLGLIGASTSAGAVQRLDRWFTGDVPVTEVKCV